MKLLLSIVSALVVMGASPALAGQHHGGQSYGGQSYGGQSYGGQSGGCRIGCSSHGGGNVNINSNAYSSAYSNAYSSGYAQSGGYIQARGYDVRSVAPRAPWMSGSSSNYYGSYGGQGYGYGSGYAPVMVSGPGYGPSRPFGYVVEGFGRRYATTDRCGPSCYAPPPPPPCDCEPNRPHYGHNSGQSSYSGRSGGSYSVRETYSESSRYGGGYRVETPRYEQPRYPAPRFEAPRFEAPRFEAPRFAAPRFEAPRYPAPVYPAPVYEAPVYEAPVYEQPVYEQPIYEQPRYEAPRYEQPRYAPTPYYASPLEPIVVQPDYAPPPVYYSHAEQPQTYYEPQPAPARPPLGYYGDLPPGDTGQGHGMPYRQEPGERG